MRKLLSLEFVLLLIIFLQAGYLSAASIRGQLLCENNSVPAVGIAVTVFNPQTGRSNPSFTGGDGMYYLNGIPAGIHTLEIWIYRSQGTPSMVYQIQVGEPHTDLPRVNLPVCQPQ
jgi:hypothetical protein